MHIAAQRNHLSICWLLLLPQDELDIAGNTQRRKRVDNEDAKNILTILDQVDKWGNTPLHTAAANGHDKLVKWFLTIGADRKTKNMFCLTPFDVASDNVCRSLLRESNFKQKRVFSNKWLKFNTMCNIFMITD